LSLSDDEIRLFSGQLAHILDYFKQLQAVDTEGVEPLAHPLAHPLAVTDVLRADEPRADEPRECFDTSTALSNAPERAGPFFRVPQVLDPSPGT